MSNSPSSEAHELLLTAGIITDPSVNGAWPGFIGLLRPEPNAQVTIVDTPGQSPNPKWLLDYPTIQIMIRGTADGYQAAWNKGLEIKNLLLGMDPHVFTSGDRWDGVTGLGDLMFLRVDDNSRPILSVNFRIIREPASTPGNARESLPL